MANSDVAIEAVGAIADTFKKESTPGLGWLSSVKWFFVGGTAALVIAYGARALVRWRAEKSIKEE
jgi:hypothetical protein